MATPAESEHTEVREHARGGGLARRVWRWRIPILAGLLCVAAIASLYATASLKSTPTRSAAVPRIGLSTIYLPERGPDGQEWRWMPTDAGLTIYGRDRFWIGFNGYSLRVPRRLVLRDVNGRVRSVEVGPGRNAYVVGPFDVNNRLPLELTATPGARRASRQDSRKLAIQLSNLHGFRVPLAVLPTVGFYDPEAGLGGGQFVWLNRLGRLQVAASPPLRQAYVVFTLSSVDTARHLSVSGPGLQTVVNVPPHGSFRTVTLGPVALTHGRATLRVASREPARRYGQDDRLLSVRFDSAFAVARRP